MTTQTEFFQQHAAQAIDGLLPDHLMAQMLALPEGDIVLGNQDGSASPGAEVEDGAPAPAATPAPSTAPAAAPAPAEPTQGGVVLAKDGVHTIPYERLEEARRLAQEATARATEEATRANALAEENARLKATSQAPSPAPAPTTAPAAAPEATEGGLFGDYSDPQLRAGIEKVIAERTAQLQQQLDALQVQLSPMQEQAQLSENEKHWRAIYGAHPDLDSLVESTELEAWIGRQPAFSQAAYRSVLDEGSAGDVVDLFNAYKDANGIARTPSPGTTPPPAATPAAQAAANAAAAIAAAKLPPPTSLSELPAGGAAHHDEAAAMFEMTPTAVLTRLEGMTPQQIEQRLSRLL